MNRPAGCGRPPLPLRQRWSSALPSPARPRVGGVHRATSPAATTRSAANSESVHTTPLSMVSPEPSSQSVAGTTPIPTTTRSASRRGPVGQVDRPPPCPAPEPVRSLDTHPGTQGHPRGPVQLGTGFAHLVTQHPAEGGGQGLHHRHRGPQAMAGGSHLGPDEPGPDDHHPGSGAGGQPRRNGSPGHPRASAGRGRGPCPPCRARTRGRAPVAMIRPS